VLNCQSVRLDLLVANRREPREITDLYDMTVTEEEDEFGQGKAIAKRIKEYVGAEYVDKNGVKRRIGYGDVVILMRSLTSKATDIYNALIAARIPVSANFRTAGYSTKEVKDVINLLRVLDNPYNDVYVAGICLSVFGKFSESELGIIRLDTEGRIPFYDRLKKYAKNGANNVIVSKIDNLIALLAYLRFYSRSSSVSDTVIEAMRLTHYQLYVQGLPNGSLRMRKLYAFIDGIKDAPYADSIEKFLSYIDEAEDNREENGIWQSDAVRMMTMHASKGLEFPVVILAGLETSFQFDRPSVACNFDLGLAMRYYDFSTMRFANTLSYAACGMFNNTKQREEEMRLLYVAMTRAQFSLNLVGTTDEKQLKSLPKLPTKANSNLDWILAVLKERYGDLTSVNGNVEVNIVTNACDASDEAEQSYLCAQKDTAQEVMRRISYRYPYETQTAMPSKVVSSALDKAYIDNDAPEFVLNADDDRNFIGTAYHKVYQYVDYNATEEQIIETIDGLVNEGKIERRYADKLDVKLIYSTLNNPELRALMSKGKVYREMPFMLIAPYDKISVDKRFTDDTILQGVIDLLIVGETSAAVIDFKYTSRSDKAAVNYKAQLASYKLATRQICGIDDVSCYILSITDNKLIEM
ncbi:MAG: PD-(D/E)XK nuclease family protein, partial [Corallococcus sp.]|nr:PD-(D/E)XK nuclease family protein [Corallococcus sp.]